MKPTEIEAPAKPVKKSKLAKALTILMYTWPLVLIVIVGLVIFISILLK